jgi:protoheme IX farnesyltransferase
MPSLKPYLTLCRVYLSLFAACSAATGYLLAPQHRVAGMLTPVAAVFFLACGASALNQYQERDIDARMERTRGRPLPAGVISPALGLSFSLVMMLAGLVLLVPSGGVQALVLGLLALFWYNGLYTGLKKVTAFAAVPGAAVGMVPPAIGWVSAGNELGDPRLLSVCFVFFLWQVPHFWLLLLRHGKEYEEAGLPSLTRVMTRPQLSRVTSVWIAAAAVSGLMLPLYGAITSPALSLALVPLAAWLVVTGSRLAAGRALTALSPLLFRKINVYIFVMMSLLALQGLVLTRP